MAGRNKDEHARAEIRIGWKMAGLGMEVATSVLGGAAIGYLIDRWRGTGQTGVMVGALVGVVVGLWVLVKGALRLNRQLSKQEQTRRAAGRRIEPLPNDAGDADDDDDW